MKIKYRKRKRKSHKLYGQKYRGYGQVGRHRHHPGGRGLAGVKDHLKIKLLKEGYVYGSGKGFVRHAIKRKVALYTVRALDGMVKGSQNIRQVEGRYVIDLSSIGRVKILGSGKITVPIRLILNENSSITEKAKEKIESVGGEIVIQNLHS